MCFLFFVLSKNIKEKYQELDYRGKMADWPDSEDIELVLWIQKSYLSVNLQAQLFIQCKDEGSMFLVFFIFNTWFWVENSCTMREVLCFEDFLFFVKDFVYDWKEICKSFAASCTAVDETILAFFWYGFEGLIMSIRLLKAGSLWEEWTF